QGLAQADSQYRAALRVHLRTDGAAGRGGQLQYRLGRARHSERPQRSTSAELLLADSGESQRAAPVGTPGQDGLRAARGIRVPIDEEDGDSLRLRGLLFLLRGRAFEHSEHGKQSAVLLPIELPGGQLRGPESYRDLPLARSAAERARQSGRSIAICARPRL